MLRIITVLRGALIGEIYEKSLIIDATDNSDLAAVTLMSTDIDRIAAGLANVLELIASPIEIILALWLLQSQIGLSCIASISAAICKLLYYSSKYDDTLILHESEYSMWDIYRTPNG